MIEVLTFIFGLFGQLFTMIFGVNLRGIPYGTIIIGMLIVTILFNFLRRFLNMEITEQTSQIRKKVKEPGKMTLKK